MQEGTRRDQAVGVAHSLVQNAEGRVLASTIVIEIEMLTYKICDGLTDIVFGTGRYVLDSHVSLVLLSFHCIVTNHFCTVYTNVLKVKAGSASVPS